MREITNMPKNISEKKIATNKNADFSEKRPDGTPKYWFFDKHSGLRAEDGKTVLYSIHNFPCKGEIEVKAGVPVTVKYESRVKTK